MSPSSLADRVLEAVLAGDTPYVAACKLGIHEPIADRMGALYLTLAKCCREIGMAADEGKIKIEEIASWRRVNGSMTKTDEEQREWLTKRLTPKETRPRAAYGSKKKAAPKPVAPAAHTFPWSEKGGKRVVEQLTEKGYEAQADLIRLLSGDFSAVGEMDPDLLELLDSAGITITPPEEAEEAAE